MQLPASYEPQQQAQGESADDRAGPFCASGHEFAPAIPALVSEEGCAGRRKGAGAAPVAGDLPRGKIEDRLDGCAARERRTTVCGRDCKSPARRPTKRPITRREILRNIGMKRLEFGKANLG